MTELSLNVLDIAQNSVKAKATLIELLLDRDVSQKKLSITIRDNGCGMTKQQCDSVCDPFFTTRTTRKVGLGVPFFKMSAEQTGGSFSIHSVVGEGTEVTAVYCYESIDMMPLGDMAATVCSLVSVNPDIDFVYSFTCGEKTFAMDTREIRQIMEGVPLNTAEVVRFIRDFINENQAETDVSAVAGGFPLSDGLQ